MLGKLRLWSTLLVKLGRQAPLFLECLFFFFITVCTEYKCTRMAFSLPFSGKYPVL